MKETKTPTMYTGTALITVRMDVAGQTAQQISSNVEMNNTPTTETASIATTIGNVVT